MSVPTGGVAMMASLSGGVVRAQPRRSKAASARSAATQSAASVASCPRPSTSSHRACLVKNNNNDILRLVKSNNNTLRTPATRARIVTTSVSATPATTTSSSPGDDAAAASADTAAAPPAPEAAKGKKRPFIPALDSTRFFLISYIAVGHFIACCTKDAFTLRLLSQVNVVVGAFFVLSGYVVAYTCTELGQYKASPRISPAPQFIMSRIMGYYPLYLLAQIIFLPVFVYADAMYNGPIATFWHAVTTFSLSQAWFPAHAELWNAPTWFLSALTFATICLPFCLPSVASWRKKGLKTAMLLLTAVSLVAKIAYSYDTNGWFFMVRLYKFNPV